MPNKPQDVCSDTPVFVLLDGKHGPSLTLLIFYVWCYSSLLSNSFNSFPSMSRNKQPSTSEMSNVHTPHLATDTCLLQRCTVLIITPWGEVFLQLVICGQFLFILLGELTINGFLCDQLLMTRFTFSLGVTSSFPACGCHRG